MKIGDDSELERDNKRDNIIRKILPKGVFIICFIIAFMFARGCTYSLVSSFKTPKYTQEDYQTSKDAGFVKGFEIVNTVALENYCSDTGYVPNTYINKFKKQFSKTILNANNILEKYATKEQIQSEIIDKIYQPSIDTLTKDYNDIQAQYGISKKQYCQLFDEESDIVLSEKIQILKQQRPNVYKD